MPVLLTYDVDGQHDTPVKNALMGTPYNYKDVIQGKSRLVKLPNTTLYHPTKTVDQASEDIVAVAKSYGAKLEKYIVLEVSNWRANDPA